MTELWPGRRRPNEHSNKIHKPKLKLKSPIDCGLRISSSFSFCAATRDYSSALGSHCITMYFNSNQADIDCDFNFGLRISLQPKLPNVKSQTGSRRGRQGQVYSSADSYTRKRISPLQKIDRLIQPTDSIEFHPIFLPFKVTIIALASFKLPLEQFNFERIEKVYFYSIPLIANLHYGFNTRHNCFFDSREEIP